MKKVLLLIATFMSFQISFAEKNEDKGSDYRRSSLCLIMLDESKLPNREVIKEAFLSLPVPDKYNDHNTSVRIFCKDTMKLTTEDNMAFKEAERAGVLGESQAKQRNSGEESGKNAGKKKGGFGKMIGGLGRSAVSGATGGLVNETANSEYAASAYKFLQQQNMAKQLFDKWFKSQDGNFTMDLVQKRGMYDASSIAVENAKSSARGIALLADAGEELINNTFVVVTRFHYLSKDELVAQIDATAQAVTEQLGGYAALGAKAGTLALKASLGAGYYVQSTSYLFQLNWNDSIAGIFYNQLWDNPEAYEQSDIFSLKYIGEEKAWANVKAGIFTDKSESELIRIATINATDAALAKLEKKYEVFKTKTPMIVSGDEKAPVITAKIGMKEGLEAGDKYEVLEKIFDPETQRTSYKRKGVVKVSKDQIWDNRFMASEERALEVKTQDFEETRFEGKGNYYTGMLLRQIK